MCYYTAARGRKETVSPRRQPAERRAALWRCVKNAEKMWAIPGIPFGEIAIAANAQDQFLPATNANGITTARSIRDTDAAHILTSADRILRTYAAPTRKGGRSTRMCMCECPGQDGRWDIWIQ